MPASDEGSEEEYERALQALSSLISGKRATGGGWTHAFEMMQEHLEVSEA
jgi:hypothetical protein